MITSSRCSNDNREQTAARSGSFAAFAHTEELERFDEYAWPYFEGGAASHWRERFLTGETSTQVFEGVPLAELRDYFSEIGIKSFRAVLNREGFERDFRIFLTQLNSRRSTMTSKQKHQDAKKRVCD